MSLFSPSFAQITTKWTRASLPAFSQGICKTPASTRRSAFAILFACIATLTPLRADNPDDPHHASIAISAAMRTWQERHLLVSESGAPVVWPQNAAGIPAGSFPDDAFYCEDLENDASAAALVRALAEAMTEFRVLPGRTYIDTRDGEAHEYALPYLANFLVAPSNGDLRRAPAHGTVADMVFLREGSNALLYRRSLPQNSPFAGITAENYEEKFAQIAACLRLLDIAFILYADHGNASGNHTFVSRRSGSAISPPSGTFESLQSVAGRALEAYRGASTGNLISATPALFIDARRAVEEPVQFSVQVASSSGYFTLDRSNGPWRSRLAEHVVDFYIRRENVGPVLGLGNYPVALDGTFQHLARVSDGTRFDSPVFEPPPPEDISVAGLDEDMLPTLAGWKVEPYLVVYGNWKHHLDSLEATCGCAACASSCESPESEPKLNSVDITISLGADADGPLGSLVLRAERPSAWLSRPSGLARHMASRVRSIVDYESVIGASPEFRFVSGSSFLAPGDFDAALDPDSLTLQRRPLRQLHAPTWMAQVVDLDEDGYRLDFVRRAGLPPPDAATGVIDMSGAEVFRSFTFSHLEGDLNRFQFTRSEPGGPDRVALYEYDPAGNAWTLATGSGPDLRRESVVRRDEGNEWTETRTVRGADDVVVSETTLRYRVFPWNDRLSPLRSRHAELIEKAGDPSGENRITRYHYFTDPGVDRAGYGQARLVEYPDGSWVRYEYDPVSGLRVRTIRPFGDAAPDAAESLCRVTIEERATLPDVDGDAVPEKLETHIERALGLEVGRSHRVEFSQAVTIDGHELLRVVEARAATPGAAWDSPDALRTESRLYIHGEDAGKMHSVIEPDGTMVFTRYARANGRLTTTREAGEPDAGRARIVRGRRTVTITHPQGSVQSVSVYDIESELLLDLAETFEDDFDAFGRPLTVVHLDGTAEQYVYGCCGLESFEDRTGMAQTHAYDSLKRRVSTTQAGLTTISIYDAAGRVVETRQRSRGGQARAVSRSEYTPGGRLMAVRDLLDRRTAFAEEVDAAGRNVRTTTRPDLATRVEIYHCDGRLLSVGGTAAHPIAYEYAVVADTHDGRAFHAQVATEIRLGAAGERTEWTRTYTDMLGRVYKVEKPAFSGAGTDASLSFYNERGQLARQRTAEGIATLFTYDGQGRLRDTALDANGNGEIDYGGIDRITRASETVLQDAARGVLRRSTISAWLTLNSDVAVVVSETDASVEHRATWSRAWSRETESLVELPGGGEVRQIVRGPDGVVSASVAVDGFVMEASVVNAQGESFGRQSFRYDEWGRREAVIDARNGETTTTFDTGDRPHTVTSPAPDAAQPRQTTIFGYDVMDRVTAITLPDGATQFRSHHPTGETRREWGARQYPVDYTYDAQGRLETMTTWQDFAGAEGSATTRWTYHPGRGTLASKSYQDGSHVDYTYTADGGLKTRLWARGLLTTYIYDPLTGDLSGIDYADDTPDIAYTYDRQGRLQGKSDAAGACEYMYTEDALARETHTAGLLAGATLERGHDLGRLASLSVSVPAGSAYEATYGYRDTQDRDTGRLATVAFGAARVTYAYEPDSQLLRETTWFQGSTPRARATTLFDRMNRLVSRTTVDGAGQELRSFGYRYNAANQREQATLETGESWVYGYDELGQVTFGTKKTTSGSAIPGYEFGYRFDNIGNRLSTITNGRAAAYQPNLLNQYEQRDAPRVVDVLGQAPDEATLRVNDLASVRTEKPGPDDYFFTPYPAAEPGAHELTIRSTVAGAPEQKFDEQRIAYQSATPEVHAHDADGNLTDDWRWHYTWNAENRLVAMETQPAAVAAGIPRQRLEFIHDHRGRRTAKRVFSWDAAAGAWTLNRDTRYLYDGWNLLCELALDLSTFDLRLSTSHLWGLDLSGSLQGAGGVGGLLLTQTATTSAIPAYDGNGNVTAYLDAATSAPIADFEYSPFGETLRATGEFAESASFRFSTKFTDGETGLVCYGFRYYHPSMGRWLSRDPVEENGGSNLYGMVGNDAVGGFDVLGLYQPDGHFYAAFIVASLNGMSARDAYRLAYYTQYPDQDQRYDAIPAGMRLVNPPTQFPSQSSPYYYQAMQGWARNVRFDVNIQKMLHSLHGGDFKEILKRRKCLVKMLQDPSLKDWERGFIAHALGDAYSHTKGAGGSGNAFDSPLGHLFAGTSPDIPWKRPELFRQYLGALNRGLGGTLGPVELDALTHLMTQKVQSNSQRLVEARKLAQYFGYSENFDPSVHESLDPNMAMIGRDAVQSLFERMQKVCGCNP